MPEEGLPELGLFPEEVSELCHTINCFDHARHEFLEICHGFAAEPSTRNAHDLNLGASLVVSAFHNSVTAITAAESDERARIAMIAHLMTEEDSERITLFKAITSCDDFSHLGECAEQDDETLAESLCAIAIEVGFDKLAEKTEEVFLDAFSKDLNHFAHHALEDYTPIPESRKKFVIKMLGRHALDVSKVAFGTALGLWFMRQAKH